MRNTFDGDKPGPIFGGTMRLLDWLVFTWLIVGLVAYIAWFTRALIAFLGNEPVSGPSPVTALRLSVTLVTLLGIVVLPVITLMLFESEGASANTFLSVGAVTVFWFTAGLICVAYFQVMAALIRRGRRRHPV
jgi:hypothetical protein